MMWIAHTQDGTIWWSGEDSVNVATQASLNYADYLDVHGVQGDPQTDLKIIPATRAVVAMVDMIGGDVKDWDRNGVRWVLNARGQAFLADQG